MPAYPGYPTLTGSQGVPGLGYQGFSTINPEEERRVPVQRQASVQEDRFQGAHAMLRSEN